MVANLLEQLRQQTGDTATKLELIQVQNQEGNEKLWRALRDLRRDLTSSAATFSLDGDVITKPVQQLESEVQDAIKSRYILSSFRYDAMQAREADVPRNHAQTFQWIFSGTSNFTQWLHSGSGLFWISGKAGSGKSTFMKYLYHTPETSTHLQQWAGHNKLVISRHFFWNAGTSMQKSYQGLLQSLCHGIFSACPDLLPQVCKEKWLLLRPEECIKPYHDVYYDVKEKWTEAEMVELIRRVGALDQCAIAQDVHLCFLIDGLDEYYGQHDQLLQAITTLSTFRNVKIIVSSRPWNVFKQAFTELSDNGQSLILQDLTRNDIKAYVQDRLESNKSFARMLENDERCSEIVTEITSKADGVFLWVYLVINEVLKSLTNHDDFVTLQRRLQLIPPGLRPYFKHMFNGLDQFYKAETAQIFRAVVVAPGPLPPLVLSTIFSTDPLAAKLLVNMRTRLSDIETTKLQTILGRRMVGCCGDLLEIKTFGRRGWTIQFLHRTVKEFLSDEDIIDELNERVGANFDIDKTMCLISLVDLRYSFRRHEASRAERTEQLFATFCTHARHLEDRMKEPPTELFETLQIVTFGTELPTRERLHLLAGMNMPLELDRAIREVSLIESKDILTSCAMESLFYLFGEASDEEGGEFDVRTMVAQAMRTDVDRRGFRIQILSSLLSHGAVASKIWHWAIPAIASRQDVPEYRRAMLFKVASELIAAGATVKGSPWSLNHEERILEITFGRADAQFLLALRKPSSNLIPSWLPWFQK